jgi:hypothetical protein
VPRFAVTIIRKITSFCAWLSTKQSCRFEMLKLFKRHSARRTCLYEHEGKTWKCWISLVALVIEVFTNDKFGVRVENLYYLNFALSAENFPSWCALHLINYLCEMTVAGWNWPATPSVQCWFSGGHLWGCSVLTGWKCDSETICSVGCFT